MEYTLHAHEKNRDDLRGTPELRDGLEQPD
jgi:hypothetical protein